MDKVLSWKIYNLNDNTKRYSLNAQSIQGIGISKSFVLTKVKFGSWVSVLEGKVKMYMVDL